MWIGNKEKPPSTFSSLTSNTSPCNIVLYWIVLKFLFKFMNNEFLQLLTAACLYIKIRKPKQKWVKLFRKVILDCEIMPQFGDTVNLEKIWTWKVLVCVYSQQDKIAVMTNLSVCFNVVLTAVELQVIEPKIGKAIIRR